MSLFSWRKAESQQDRKSAVQQQPQGSEQQRRQEELADRFESGIRSLEPVFTEAIGLGIGGDELRGATIARMLSADLTAVVVAIIRTKGVQNDSKEGVAAAAHAHLILRRLDDRFRSMDFPEYRALCGEMAGDTEFPAFRIEEPLAGFGMLTAMREYGLRFGTNHGYTVAALYLAFVKALDAAPELKGARILAAYASALEEYLAEKPSNSGVTENTQSESATAHPVGSL